MTARSSAVVRACLCFAALVAGGCAARPQAGSPGMLPPAPGAPAVTGRTTVTVTSVADGSAGSLRTALGSAPSGATIVFQLPKYSTIALTRGTLTLARNVTITGPGAGLLAISGNGTSRILSVAKGVVATVSGVTLTGGAAAQGAAAYNLGSLTLDADAFDQNVANGTAAMRRPESLSPRRRFDPRPRTRRARLPKPPRAPAVQPPSVTATTAEGAAIYNGGSLTVASSSFVQNIAPKGAGGAIYNAPGAALTVTKSSFSKNQAALGGAIYTAGTASLSGDTLSENTGFPGAGAPVSGAYGYGAALYVLGKTTVTSCAFKGNVAGGPIAQSYGVGGAIAQFGGALTVAQSAFQGNLAGGGTQGSWGTGGALYATAGSLVLTGDTVNANRAGGDAFGYGGGVYGDIAIRGSQNTIEQNIAYGSAGGGYAYGGGIYAGAAVSLDGDTVTGNAARGGGAATAGYAFGGALMAESTSTLTSVTFSANHASGGLGGTAEAGAVYAGGGSSVWTTLTFAQNGASATGASSYAAGGAVVASSALSIDGSTTLTSNSATAAKSGALGGVGGAIAVNQGPFFFTGIVEKNQATTQGGAFWIADVADIKNSLLQGNGVTAVQNAGDGGGAVYVSLEGALTLDGSTLTTNATAGAASYTGGGGVFNAGSMGVTNSTLTGNVSSDDGGGIENESAASVALTNATVFKNSATHHGGNFKNLFADSVATIANTILAGGTGAGLADDVSNDGSVVSADYNIVQTTPTGHAITGTMTHDIAADPKLAALANNGGPTPTNADGIHSPGTKHIPYGICYSAGVSVDQRGYTRNPGNSGYCDVGAYNNQYP